MSNKPVPDHLFHIPTLHCANCNEQRNFYLDDAKPFCDCCNAQLPVTQKDIDSVADRSPRAAILRFKTKTA